jgi:hypothetical protein
MKNPKKVLSGCRVLIVSGPHAGHEGVCLGRAMDGKKWSVSPDESNEILDLEFDIEFGLLVDLSGEAQTN